MQGYFHLHIKYIAEEAHLFVIKVTQSSREANWKSEKLIPRGKNVTPILLQSFTTKDENSKIYKQRRYG